MFATVSGARFTGHSGRRSSWHASFDVPGIGGELLFSALDVRGIPDSSGLECATGRGEPPPVLLAMGFDLDAARTAAR